MSSNASSAQSDPRDQRWQFPNWAYGMVKPNDDREPDPRLAARKLAADLLKAHYG